MSQQCLVDLADIMALKAISEIDPNKTIKNLISQCYIKK